MPAVGLCCKPDKFSPYRPNLVLLEAGAIGSHLRMLMGEGIATVKKNYCTHSDRGPSGAQVSVACQKRILRGAV